MKLIQIINAYKTLETLSENTDLTKQEQWSIYKLRNRLKTHIEFEQEREELVKNKYLPLADKEGRLFGENFVNYKNEIDELLSMDVDVDKFDKPKIKFVKGITCKITDPLEEFVEFLPPDE